MSEKLESNPDDSKSDPFGAKGYLVDPLTGERIYAPERAREIDADLDEKKRKAVDKPHS